jgi:hypothetical protein
MAHLENYKRLADLQEKFGRYSANAEDYTTKALISALCHRRTVQKGQALQNGRTRAVRYCTELATDEKTLFALEPISRIVPTTITRITASITAYSAMS